MSKVPQKGEIWVSEFGEFAYIIKNIDRKSVVAILKQGENYGTLVLPEYNFKELFIYWKDAVNDVEKLFQVQNNT
nr:MAG TPA: hypothetical protein [Caudoviricetes sp.]